MNPIAKVLTLITLSLLFFNLSAQNSFEDDPKVKLPDEDRTFRLGIQLNPNLSWVKSNRTGFNNDGTGLGFAYGLSFEYFLSKNYLISSGIFLQHAPAKVNYKGTTEGLSDTSLADVEAVYKMRYIEIPFTLKLRTNEIGYFTYFANIGIKTGFNYKSKATFNYTYKPPNEELYHTYDFDLDDASKHTSLINMSIVLGAGVEFNISGNTNLMVGITFNNGFINQFSRTVSDSPEDLTKTNESLSDKDANANLNYFALNIGIYF